MIFSPNSIPPQLDMTCFVSKRVLQSGEHNVPHFARHCAHKTFFLTQISLSGFVDLFLLIWNTFLLRDRNPICEQFNVQSKRRLYRYCRRRRKKNAFYLNATTLYMVHIFFTEMSICTFESHVIYH